MALSVLPTHGVVVVATSEGLHTHRTLDGTLICRISVDMSYVFAAADSASGLVFAGLSDAPYACARVVVGPVKRGTKVQQQQGLWFRLVLLQQQGKHPLIAPRCHAPRPWASAPHTSLSGL